jgi:hypothetical protein
MLVTLIIALLCLLDRNLFVASSRPSGIYQSFTAARLHSTTSYDTSCARTSRSSRREERWTTESGCAEYAAQAKSQAVRCTSLASAAAPLAGFTRTVSKAGLASVGVTDASYANILSNGRKVRFHFFYRVESA